MGLDMYLTAKCEISEYLDPNDSERAETIKKLFPELEKTTFQVNEVSIEVGYWRKANHIHKWFVDNVQSGVDECKRHYVSREKLLALKETCQKVLENKELSSELLPTQSGFFFGSTSYDEYYYDILENTLAIMDYALSLPDNWHFEYCSSW